MPRSLPGMYFWGLWGNDSIDVSRSVIDGREVIKPLVPVCLAGLVFWNFAECVMDCITR